MEKKSILDAPKPIINAAYVEGYAGGMTQTMSSPRVPIVLGSVPRNAILDMDFEQVQFVMELEKEFPEFKKMDPNGRAEFIQGKIEKFRTKMEEEKRKSRDLSEQIDQLKYESSILEGLSEWASQLRMEKPDGPSFRKMRQAVANGDVVYLAKKLYTKMPSQDFEKNVFRFAEIMLIEHNWASAFKSADISDAVVKLPYDVCAFEFRFSGRPVIALATQFDTDIAFCPALSYGDTWVISEFVLPVNGFDFQSKYSTTDNIWTVFEQMALQIRAACIALDAEVAVSEIVRQPHTSTRGANNYQALKNYHVVSLANRGLRVLPMAESTETGRRIRLHFRRGHWRHFESHKTWIKWMLVGDPDLGFVDKHYKL